MDMDFVKIREKCLQYDFILKQTQVISSCHITTLLIDDAKFTNQVQKVLTNLELDERIFINRLTNLFDLTIIVKIKFYAAYCAILRLKTSYENYQKDVRSGKFSRGELNQRFTERILQLEENLLTVAQNDRFPDIARAIYSFNYTIHVNTIAKATQPLRSDDVISRNKHTTYIILCGDGNNLRGRYHDLLDDYIYFVSCLYSYSTINPQLHKIMVPAKNDLCLVDLDIHSKGPNNLHYKDDNDVIASCLFCQLNNLFLGHTDYEEQCKRTTCECILVYSSNNIDNHHFAASTLTRKSSYQLVKKNRNTINYQLSKVMLLYHHLCHFITTKKTTV